MLFNYLTVRYGQISVLYTKELHGGGILFADHFAALPEVNSKKHSRIFEFCAGPGFIGYKLLSLGLCDTLCFSDINPKAAKMALRTAKLANLEELVTYYVSDSLQTIPRNEKWDLVLSNPPHFSMNINTYHPKILWLDKDWLIHKSFYKSIKQHLAEDGTIIMFENINGGDASSWSKMLFNNGLKMVREHKVNDTFYFMIIKTF